MIFNYPLISVHPPVHQENPIPLAPDNITWYANLLHVSLLISVPAPAAPDPHVPLYLHVSQRQW